MNHIRSLQIVLTMLSPEDLNKMHQQLVAYKQLVVEDIEMSHGKTQQVYKRELRALNNAITACISTQIDEENQTWKLT